MTAHVAIGEFSRLTYLSVKTLHHYHDVGLLEPDSIDGSTGYRRYSLEQVPKAHLIRRLRDLNMPVAQVREVLTAPDQETRDAALRAHLARMEAELARTQEVVASLRQLLAPAPPLAVEFRTIPTLPVIAVTAVVARNGFDDWFGTAFGDLSAALERAGVAANGTAGATYAREFFEDDAGEVVAFLPVPAGTGTLPGVARLDLPGGRYAVAVHAGPFEDFDRTYGALGSRVAEDDVGLPEPIRELYLVGTDETDDPRDYRTEICWPVRSA